MELVCFRIHITFFCAFKFKIKINKYINYEKYISIEKIYDGFFIYDDEHL